MLQRNSAFKRRATLLVGGFIAGSLMVANLPATIVSASGGANAPAPVNDAVVTFEDTPVVITPTVNDVNPVATPLGEAIAEGTAAATCSGVDGSGVPLNIGATANVDAGASVVVVNGACRQDTITYIPIPGTSYVDTFDYDSCDVTGANVPCTTAQITVTVQAVNDAPVGGDDVAVTPEDTPVVIDLGVGDSDPDDPATDLTWSPFGAVGGTVSAPFDGPDGDVALDEVTFTPLPLNSFGPAGFSYTLCDDGNPVGPVLCDVVNVVLVTVTPVNDAPVAVDDALNGTAGSSILGFDPITPNDSDVDDALATLAITAVTPIVGGITASISGGGTTIDFVIPPGTPNGLYPFSYTLTDPGALSDGATIFLVVTSNGPQLMDDTASTPEDTLIDVDVLANDLDPFGPVGSQLMITWISQGVDGNATANLNVPGDGLIRYIPDPNFNGHDVIAYIACNDTNGLCDVGLLQITVAAVNDAPVGQPDQHIMLEDSGTASIFVLTNDSDEDQGDDGSPPAQTIHIGAMSASSNPTLGTFELIGTSPPTHIDFTPAPDQFGSATVTYQVCDDYDSPMACTDTTLTVTVLAVNDAPVAIEDFASTPEETLVNIDLDGNDSDVDGAAPYTIVITTAPAHGALSNLNNATGTIDYTPATDYNGLDYFWYTLCDNVGGCSLPTKVTISVTPVNDRPTANIDVAFMGTNQILDVDVLANDIDPEGDPLIVQSVTLISSGTAPGNAQVGAGNADVKVYSGGAEGLMIFNPYTIADAGGQTATSSVWVVVCDPIVNGAPECGPTAVDDADDIAEDGGFVDIPVTANDLDPVTADLPLEVVAVENGLHGTASVVGAGNDTVRYQPDPNFNGSDSFDYIVCNQVGECDVATISVTVTPVDDTPIGGQDVLVVAEDSGTTNVGALANDFDFDEDDSAADGGPGPQFIYVDSVTAPVPAGSGTTGLVGASPASDVSFTPAANYTGPASFTYVLCDSADPSPACDTVTVLVVVTPVNDIPFAGNDVHVVAEDSAAAPINVGLNDGDLDLPGEVLTWSAQTAPSHGSISVFAGSIISYTPAPNYSGPDSFTYKVCDDENACASATVNILVTPTNDGPTANIDVAFMGTNEVLDVPVLANDFDPEGDTLTVTSVALISGGPAPGNAQVGPGNTSVRVYSGGAEGLMIFAPYTISDGNGGVSAAAVWVVVCDPVLECGPTATDDGATTAEDTLLTGIPVLANDLDPVTANLPLEIVAVEPGSHGLASISGGGTTVDYMPAQNFNGQDSFDYIVCNAVNECDVATITVNVTPVDDTPVGGLDFLVVNEDSGPVAVGALANDFDFDQDDTAADGGPPAQWIYIDSVTDPAGGSTGLLGASPANDVEFAPDPNFTGATSFTYVLCDNQDPSPACDTVTVNVWVNAINDVPFAGNDAVVVAEDSGATAINVGLNDGDLDLPGEVLTWTLQSAPSNGSVGPFVASTISYTPAPNFSGLDSFTYKVCDDENACAFATVNVTVTPLADAPIANPDGAATLENAPVLINVLANDTDADGDTLSLTTITVAAANGIATIQGNAVLYTPDLNFTGIDTFTYQITDGTGLFATAVVTVDVGSVNNPPVANNDVAVTAEDSGLLVINVLANDFDPDGAITVPPYTVTPGLASHGTVVPGAGGAVNYTPNANYNGPDSFQYTLCDPLGACDVATVNVTVTPVADLPVANPDGATTSENTPVSVNVLANDFDADGDTLTLTTITVAAANGMAVINGNVVDYTPNLNYTGIDTFTYEITDGNGNFATAVVTVDVGSVNNPPVANDDVAAAVEGGPLVPISVLANDIDPDGAIVVPPYTVTPGLAIHGTVTPGAAGVVNYTPNADFFGVDTFTYWLCDPLGACDMATVNVQVAPTADLPVANPDGAVVAENGTVLVDVLANDYDADGDTLTITTITVGAVNGSAVIEGNQVRYTPNLNYTGPDSFTYQITDGNGNLASALVTINVTSVNLPPTANDDVAVVVEDGGLVAINVIANDTDPDGPVTVPPFLVIPGLAAHGLVALGVGGAINYTPFLNYYGNDQFNYILCDPNGLCDMATVFVQVSPVNDPPVGNDDMASTTVGSAINIPVLLNDSDIDGGPLTITAVSAATGGLAVVGPGGTSINYLAPAVPGVYTFTYDISDGNGGTDTGILVTVFVGYTEAGAPLVLNDAWSTWEDTAVDIDVLVNDCDVTDPTLCGPLTINWVTQAAHGNVSVNDTVIPGQVHYIPDPQFNGHDYFTYTACNIFGLCTVGSVVVTVASVNDVPVARDDLALISEDSPTVDIDVLANDSDEDDEDDGQPPAQTIYVNAITSPPAFGDAVIVGTGPTSYIQYTPGPDFNGYDQFDYEICDTFDYPATPPASSPGDCDIATVVINVKAVNDPPLIVNDQLTVPEDGISAPFDPTLNDVDVEDGTPNLTQVTQPAHGSVAVLPGGLVRYFPHANWWGSDSFTYQACDSGGLCGWGTVYVTVGPIEDAPVANNDVAVTQEEAPPITIDVLANDYDMDNLPALPSNWGLQVANITQPAAGGGIAWIQNNKVMYMPDLMGVWTFTYDACDQELNCSTAIVTVFVSRKNNPPVGLIDVAATLEDTMVSIPVLANDVDPDGDPLHIGWLTVPTMGGQVVINGANVEYTPALNFNGIDTFTYVACDFLGACSAPTIVQVTVGAVPDNPYAVDDLFFTPEDTPVVLTVLHNDSDGDDQDLRICAITIPPMALAAIATIQGSGANADTILYTPGHGLNGHDQLTYQVGDGPCGAASTRFDTAVVNIIVLPVNQGVTAIDDIATTPVGEAVNIDVKANDFDNDNPPDPITVKGVSANGVNFDVELWSASGNGRITVWPDNTVHYDPIYGFEGQDEFWYKVCDPYDSCAVARVTVSVGHADAPANSISGSVYFDLNLNGVLDFAEPDVLGVRVQLWAAGDDTLIQTGDDFLVSETTIAGPYLFDHIPCNTTYLLRIDPASVPPGFIYSDDPSDGLDGLGVIATGGNTCTFTGQNFGLVLGADLPETK